MKLSVVRSNAIHHHDSDDDDSDGRVFEPFILSSASSESKSASKSLLRVVEVVVVFLLLLLPMSLSPLLSVVPLSVAATTTTTTASQQQNQHQHRRRQLATKEMSSLPETEQQQLHLQSILLHNKKHRLFRKQPVPLTQLLFPGVTPEVYNDQESIYIITELVTSTKTNVPFEFYDLPGSCTESQITSRMKYFTRQRKRHSRRNLGIRLQGLDLTPSPHTLQLNRNMYCTPTCTSNERYITNPKLYTTTTTTDTNGATTPKNHHHMTSTGSNTMIQPQYIENHQIRHLRKLIDHQYRIHLMLDQLPVLMKSPTPTAAAAANVRGQHPHPHPQHAQYAIRGYPVGFKAPPSYTGSDRDEYFLYNHLKFTITIREVAVNTADNTNNNPQRYHITGFEVYPVSIDHDFETGSTCYGLQAPTDDEEEEEEEEVGDDGNEEEGKGDEGDDGSNTGRKQQNEDEGEEEDEDNTTDDGGSNNNKEGGDTDGGVGDDAQQQQEEDQNRRHRRRRLSVSRKTKQSKRDKYQVINDPDTYLKLRLSSDNNNNNNNKRNSNTQHSIPILYTYEVEWVINPDLEWSDRWDIYLLGSPDDNIHFFAIVNSFMIVLFLTGAIAIIMIRTLRKDILAYNNTTNSSIGGGGGMDDLEESGWKLVHGDVFRPPSYHPMLLAVLVGTGAQIGTAIFSTMIIAVLKIVNPIKKGQTLTAIVILYVFSGCVSGYVSARIHKLYDLKRWKMNTLLTATTLPGLLIGVFTVLNVLLSFQQAATAVSIWLLLGIFALWVCVSSPLVFIGAYFGYRSEKISVPVKTNHIARLIPKPLPWYSTPPMSFLLGGILPFGSVCIELFFILSALWLHQIYYVMGFLLVVLLILAATCAQVSIVMDYLQLCAEDYKWWWKSFGNCASAGLYLFLYSIWFLMSRLKLVGLLPVIIYITYMFLISLCFGLCCGSIGFGCALWFNRQIYGALKVD